jgi:ABC-type nitrate/sulfonate/bicarbonate transport system substrate-binding protein
MSQLRSRNLGVAMLAIAGALAFAPAVSAQTVTIDVASTASLYPQFYPLAIGEELDAFKKEGITIRELATSGGGATVAPVISGDTPIGLASMSSAILARLEGAPIKIISGVSPNFLSTIVYAVHADSKIQKLSQLTGQNKAKIGYTSGGSITDTASAVMAREEKLREGVDVERVALGSMQATTAALLTRQIEVEVANVNAVADYVVKGNLRIVGDTSDYMKNYEANAVIVNAAYLEKNKDAVRRFLRVYSQAAAYGNANKPWTEALYSKRAKVAPEAAAIILKKLEWTTALSYEGFVNQLDLLKQNGDVKKDVDAKRLYDGLVDLSLLP